MAVDTKLNMCLTPFPLCPSQLGNISRLTITSSTPHQPLALPPLTMPNTEHLLNHIFSCHVDYFASSVRPSWLIGGLSFLSIVSHIGCQNLSCSIQF